MFLLICNTGDLTGSDIEDDEKQKSLKILQSVIKGTTSIIEKHEKKTNFK